MRTSKQFFFLPFPKVENIELGSLMTPLDQYLLMGTGYPPQQHYTEKSGPIASKERWALRPMNIDLPASPLHPLILQ